MPDDETRKRTDDQEGAATLATKHLIDPKDGKLVEVSYLPAGVVHSLTMLQALEQHFDSFVKQIRAMQLWYLKREARRKGFDEEWIEKEYEQYTETDIVDLKNLFIHRFRYAFYQSSRGRDGKFAEALILLADTDMQTRSTDLEGPFKHIREQ